MKKFLFSVMLASVVAFTAAGVVAAQEAVVGQEAILRQEGDATGGTEIGPHAAAEQMEVSTSEDGVEYVPGELVVVKKGGPEENNVDVVTVEETTLKGLKDRAAKVKASRPDAEAVEPNYFYRSDAVPDDPFYGDQYFFGQIGAPGAWNDTRGAGVRICVADSGYDHGNPEFASKVFAERDVVGDVHDGYAEDDTGHGSLTAGIAAAETDNAIGTAGVGWLSKLVIAKATFNANGVSGGSSADLAQALNWCQHVGGVSVVNVSSSGPHAAAIESEVADADAMGMNVVAAVGNQGAFTTRYPAGYPGVIGVGATDRDGSLASYSNRGPSVDLVAPGQDILSAYPNNKVASATGTSFSAPMVAGGAALLRAKGLGQDQVRNRLFNQAEDRGPAGRDGYWGHGFLNLRCATDPTLTSCN